jgi:hypothetical protein
MQNQRDHRKNEQQVDEPARDMKYGKAHNPRDQQNHEQNCPDTHFFHLSNLRAANTKATAQPT